MAGVARPKLDRTTAKAAMLRRAAAAPPREPLGPTMSDVKLADLRAVAVSCRENSMRFEGFRQNVLVSSLGWPDDVVEQFLYDHADNIGFLRDYGDLDLSKIEWDVEVIRSRNSSTCRRGRLMVTV